MHIRLRLPSRADQNRSSMANPHYRVYDQPRISANELASFPVASLVGQERIIRNAHWQLKPPVIRYKDARQPLQRFLASPTRDQRILEAAKSDLEARAANPNTRPLARDDALASIGAIEDFQRAWNAFPFGGLNFDLAPRQMPSLYIEGVEVSVALDAIVNAVVKGDDVVGGVLLRLAKGTDAETEAAAAKRREIGKNAAVIVFLFAREHLTGRGQPSYKHCFSVDVQRMEAHAAPRGHVQRTNNLKVACRVIQAMWDRVDPPPDFIQ